MFHRYRLALLAGARALLVMSLIAAGCAAPDAPPRASACDGSAGGCNLPGPADLALGDGPCTPRRCDSGGRTRCGAVPDGCGAMLDCGGCGAPETCGGGGVPSECGCQGQSEADFCAAHDASCGAVTGMDRCNRPRTAFCGTCAAPESCGGGGKNNVCGCTPESDAVFCAEQAKNCGIVNAGDRCGKARTADCGPCNGFERCGGGGVANVCGCDESEMAFCVRLGAACGNVVDLDLCGRPRVVTCGGCALPQTCGGAGVAFICGCAAELDADLCQARGAACGSIQSVDRCGAKRIVNCGACALPDSCGGGGTPNLCGCAPESQAALCLSLGAGCGSVTAVDHCGGVRMLACGSCNLPQTCGGGGVTNACGCTPDADANECTRAGLDCGMATVTDNCGAMRPVACGVCGPYLTCGGGGKANLCGCTPESNPAFCARLGATCGSLNRADNCGHFRTLVCGACPMGAICNGSFACVAEPSAPRLIAPIANSWVTSHRPLLKFVLGPNTDSARIQICLDRACAAVIATIETAGPATPKNALSPGRYFFRGLGISKGLVAVNVASVAWPFWVRVQDGPVDSFWGAVPDIDNDGRADIFTEQGPATQFSKGLVEYFRGGGGSQTLPCQFSACGYGIGTGDLDGNGYADAIYGDGANGITVAFNGPLAKGTPPSVHLDTGSPPTFGGPMTLTGDLDGDGFTDLVVNSANLIAIYPGTANGPAAQPVQIIGPPEPGDPYFPQGLAIGDIDGDRYADLVTASGSASSYAGRVYYYRGDPRGLAGKPTLTLTNPTPQRARFGMLVAGAGDVNGDGYDDVIVSDAGQTNALDRTQPNAYLLYGGAQGLGTQGMTIIVSQDPVVAFDPKGGTGYGNTLAALGDVNADGFDDVAIAAPNVAAMTGEVYVHLGGAKGLNPVYARLLLGPVNRNESFGGALAGFDFDGDGYSDLIVSAANHSIPSPNGPVPVGRIYWYRGSAQGIGNFSAGIFDNGVTTSLGLGGWMGRVQ